MPGGRPATLAANPAFGKAVVGAWYEVMAILASDTAEGAKARAMLGEASGTDQAGYESQLKGMKMFWTPADSLAFITSAEAFAAMDSVRRFSFAHGLLGEGADSADFIGISFLGVATNCIICSLKCAWLIDASDN